MNSHVSTNLAEEYLFHLKADHNDPTGQYVENGINRDEDYWIKNLTQPFLHKI